MALVVDCECGCDLQSRVRLCMCEGTHASDSACLYLCRDMKMNALWLPPSSCRERQAEGGPVLSSPPTAGGNSRGQA